LSAELVVAQPIMEDDRVLNRGGLWGRDHLLRIAE
jgi:hypothetical protein